MIEPILNGIYYFKRNGNQVTPVKCRLFNYEEEFRIETAVHIMDRLFGNLNRSVAAGEAFDEFIEETSKPNSDNPFAREIVDRRFRSFIFEWKLYTEHWKKYIYELDDSAYLDEFVAGYKDLFKQLMDYAYKNSDFVLAHVIRNYISHANDAIHHSHIDGKNNQFFAKRDILIAFLNESIGKAKGKQKTNLESQLSLIQGQEELLDLAVVAEKAMDQLRIIETALMNYQLEPQTLQSINILLDAKRKIDEAGIENDLWEILRPEPVIMTDHSSVNSITMETTIHGEKIRQTIYRKRMNWIGYEAMASYVTNIVLRAKGEAGDS